MKMRVVTTHRRWLCSSSIKERQLQWAVKQVTRSNFGPSLKHMTSQISAADFVSVSLQTTGSFSATDWRRPLPFDSAAAAYSKAKSAADRFHLFQLALCPFSLDKPSSLLAHPYNYVLFPRDELKAGLPTYSFSCQSSHLTSMAKEGFDFNTCIYDGISYVSRAQESGARARLGSLKLGFGESNVDGTPITIADSVFIERIRIRILNWKNTCKKKKELKNVADSLIGSLGKIIMASQYHGSRPCTDIDVCSERQVELSLQMLKEFSDELVPLVVPAKGGGTQSVRVVYTHSERDKKLFEEELLQIEESEVKKIQGFREVIDLISASKKPLVSYNSLSDFTFIYSKFIGPLPPTVEEFASSLRNIFPNVIDVSHLMKVIDPLRKVTNIPVAISHLNTHFSAPVEVQIPWDMSGDDIEVHGHNAVRICHLFVKLCSILNIELDSSLALEDHTNVFNSVFTGPQESTDQGISSHTNNKKFRCSQLVFLWGFGSGTTAAALKHLLEKSHSILCEEFDVQLVDKSCAVMAFSMPGSAEKFLDIMNSDTEITGPLREVVSEGLRVASYVTYLKVCKLVVLEADLGESFDSALGDPDKTDTANLEAASQEIYWPK